MLLFWIEFCCQIERLRCPLSAVLDGEGTLLGAAEKEFRQHQQILHVTQVVHLTQRSLL